MEDIALPTFEPIIYLTIPQLTARSYVSLSNALDGNAPAEPSEEVEDARAYLKTQRVSLEVVLDTRRRGTSKQLQLAETNLDGATDGAWVEFRNTLRAKTIYARPGFVALAADEDAKIDYAALVDRAERAQVLLDRLFGREGLIFLRYKFADQVAATASILRIIKEDKLAAEIDAVTGENTVALLRDLQARYEVMVSERAAREAGGADALKLGSARVRQAIQLYATAVMGMINLKKPATIGIVEDALRPILSFRGDNQRSRGSAGADQVVEVVEVVEGGEVAEGEVEPSEVEAGEQAGDEVEASEGELELEAGE